MELTCYVEAMPSVEGSNLGPSSFFYLYPSRSLREKGATRRELKAGAARRRGGIGWHFRTSRVARPRGLVRKPGLAIGYEDDMINEMKVHFKGD